MDVRTRAGSYLCLLVAVLATGCETLRGARADRVAAPAPVGPTRADPVQPGPGLGAPAPTGPAPVAPTQLPPPAPTAR
ncbi:hypothetical protein [Frigoriglobus tundricola]|uniref:Uncharacterized protein n=1 Tax=Frigoriglobus tundricola TaxID=2774151 RepID=A0A6M5YLE2_9BACT|nr:hypothetical protein [Frigoriglobus tundricola]QJW94394.1 hypothetical protein FTUN_1914 [Frigoriglobus tundricola]